MTLTEIIPSLNNLKRNEKIYLLQIIVNKLAEEEKLQLIPNEDYPIYSPLNAFEAADTLLKLLEENKLVYPQCQESNPRLFQKVGDLTPDYDPFCSFSANS